MKTKLTALFSFLILIVCTGCPYESKFRLSGDIIEYDKDLIGEWKKDKVDLKITRIDNKKFKYQFNDNDPEFGIGKFDGEGYVVSKMGKKYVIAELPDARKDSTGKIYYTYKIERIKQNSIIVLPLEEENPFDPKTYSSVTEFTDFVTKNATAFRYSTPIEFKRNER